MTNLILANLTALMSKIERFPHSELHQRHNMGNHILQMILSLDARALRRISNEEVLAIVRREGVQLDALTCVFFQKQAGVFERAPTYLARREADIRKRAQDRIQKGT